MLFVYQADGVLIVVAATRPHLSAMRPTVHELLAAYIRTAARWRHRDPATFRAVGEDGAPDPEIMKLRASDVDAAITVLGRRTEVPDEVLELRS